MTLYRLVAIVHALAGAFALIAFWIPVLTRKGGKNHRRVGWWYVWAMAVVLVLAVGLVGAILIAPAVVLPQASPEGARRFASFLAILPLLTFNGGWQGIGALRGFAGGAVGRWSNRVLLVAGLVELGLALLWRSPLHGIFGGIAVISGIGSLRGAPGESKRERIAAHLSGMLATGIAAHTAFLVFGAPRLIPGLNAGTLGAALWVLPTAVGTVAIALWSRRYRAPRATALPQRA